LDPTEIIKISLTQFAPSTCKLLFQNWSGPNRNLVLAGQSTEVVEKFIYLGSCISPGGLTKNEVTLRIGKERAHFSSLQHLRRRRDINLFIMGRVYNAAVRSVLLYGYKIWTLQTEALREFIVGDHPVRVHTTSIQKYAK